MPLRNFLRRTGPRSSSKPRIVKKRAVELVTINRSLLENIELEESVETPREETETVSRNEKIGNRNAKPCVQNVKEIGNVASLTDTQCEDTGSTENQEMSQVTLLERVPLRGIDSSEWTTQEDPTGLIRTISKRHKRTIAIALTASFLSLAVLISFAVGAIIIRSNYSTQANNNAPVPVEVTPIELNLLKHQWILPDIESRINDSLGPYGQSLNMVNSETPKKSSTPIIVPIPILFKSVPVPDTDIQDAIIAGKIANKKREEIEHKLLKTGNVPSVRSDVSRHQYFHKTTPESKRIESLGFTMENAYKFLITRLNASEHKGRGNVLRVNLHGALPPEWCPPREEINECIHNETNPYRTADGSCNDLFYNTKWGSANQPFRRIMLPYYADGVSSIRSKAANGESLPSPREISLKVHINNHQDDTSASLMLPLWGQFIENDMVSIAGSTGPNGSSISCCDEVNLLENQHPECIPIVTPPKSVANRKLKGQCMTVVRSAPFANCEFGPREQFNQVSAFLDASHIYGSSRAETDAIRVKKKGLLQTFRTANGCSLLPIISDPKDECQSKEEMAEARYCFKSGTSRVNEVTSLTALHTIWMRQHNKIANNLVLLNPHWDDETVFQETRRIVIAQIQHLTYNEFLPAVVGPKIMKYSGMELDGEDYYKNYESNLNPTISNVFATTAIRFTYSMMQGVIQMIGPERSTEFVQLRTMQFNPFPLWTTGKLDAIIRGMANAPAAKVDTYFTNQLSQHSTIEFNNKTDVAAFDFVAVTIQLGRDHGLETYTSWREVCGLSVVKEFSDLTDIWDDGAALLISDTYKSIQDVDLYTGVLAEKPVAGGMVGETLACLLTDQFIRLKQGDRFWYEGDIQYKPFSIEQLTVIRETTLSRILCDNSDSITEIQMNSMMQKSKSNPLVRCADLDIPKINLGPWREFQLSSTPRSTDRINTPANGTHFGDLDDEVWTKDELENSAESKLTVNGSSIFKSTNVSTLKNENISTNSSTNVPNIIVNVNKSATNTTPSQFNVTSPKLISNDIENPTTETPNQIMPLQLFTLTTKKSGVEIKFPKSV